VKIKCLGCEALTRIIYLCAAQSPHLVDIELFRLGLHREPANLRVRLQERIDACVGQGYDAIVLAYGLCGQTTAGLIARDVPLVIPRAHDCITLFLGARERYQEQFVEHPGTYWYALDYVERNDSPGNVLSLGSDTQTDMGTVYDEYVAKYGKDNADYLMEVMGAWTKHYNRAAFIDTGVGESSAIAASTELEAARRGWVYERVAGEMGLVRGLMDGDWGADFLIVQPGQAIAMTYDTEIIGCVDSRHC
jgi:hypothetical protein